MVVRLDQLQRLLGRDPRNATRQTRHPGIVSVASAKDVVRRWVKNGLAVSTQIYHQQPAYVWLSAAGQREAGIGYEKTFGGNSTRLRHYYHVNEARLWCESRYGVAIEWRSERWLIAQKEFVELVTSAGKVAHYLDGLIIKHEPQNSYTIGVEVEISNKDTTRTLAILTALAAKYESVAYFVTKDTIRSVRNRIRQLSHNDQEVFQVIELTELAF